ncbi:uncharacterized protein LOC112260883 isoform X5 [Oncorhynchus tshawytscha]|uniref:uncharacterized protein LOC112260883 isoform X5 n=1 Tax=Oncorhynchus tshawytscha TaxID=74940 RepID=UPI001C3E72EE|nr:uncharacterized protein LOC112260883 isoform X5 [Oncorhynchus tshawytscha]
MNKMESSEDSAQFVDKYMPQLIQRVTMVMPIADELLAEDMIHEEMYSNISAARTNKSKMRELFKALHSGGNKVKSTFLSALRENEPNLVQDLECSGKQRGEPENKSTATLKYKEFIRDCWVLKYCFQHCECIQTLILNWCKLSAEKIQILLPALEKCQHLELQVDDLADDDLDDLLAALGEGKSLELDLTENNFSDEKVQDLLVALTKHKPRNIDIGVKSITSNTADKFMFLINKAHADLESIGLHCYENVTLEANLQKNGVSGTLQTSLWLKVSDMKMICDCIRASGYSLSEIDLSVSYVADLSDTDVDDLSAIIHPVDKLRLRFQHKDLYGLDAVSEGLHSQISLRGIEITLCGDPVFDWRKLFQLVHTLEQHPDWDEHVEALISLLHSQTSLEDIGLFVSRLTERCATSVISLSQACPNLRMISLHVVEHGLLLEEVLQRLRASKRRPDCRVLVAGWRCRKPADQCTGRKDWSLCCDDSVTLNLHGETFTENVIRHGKKSDRPSYHPKSNRWCVVA